MGDQENVHLFGDVGVCQIDEQWVHISRVRDEDLEEWKVKKWNGSGREPRLAGNKVDAAGRRFMSETEALQVWQPPKVLPPGVFSGPPVTFEYLDGLRAAGVTLISNDASWRQRA
eukprot:8230629-Karenia_brevis.AAC.1